MKPEFDSVQSCEIVKYIKKKYGRSPEHLWASTPEFAVWRRADNEKWFAGLFVVRQNKIDGGASNSRIEILNLRSAPAMTEMIVDKKQIFPGWHMNKRHWITIPLDGRMDIGQIKTLLDNSYVLALKK